MLDDQITHAMADGALSFNLGNYRVEIFPGISGPDIPGYRRDVTGLYDIGIYTAAGEDIDGLLDLTLEEAYGFAFSCVALLKY